jgi:hypothetical protein
MIKRKKLCDPKLVYKYNIGFLAQIYVVLK